MTPLQVGPDQLPSLHHLLAEAAAVLGMVPPDLFVRQVPPVELALSEATTYRFLRVGNRPLYLEDGPFMPSVGHNLDT